MPVSVEKLREAQKPLAERIMEFLRKNPGQGYNDIELYSAVEGADDSTIKLLVALSAPNERVRLLTPLRGALDDLILRQQVIAYKYQGRDFYSLA